MEDIVNNAGELFGFQNKNIIVVSGLVSEEARSCAKVLQASPTVGSESLADHSATVAVSASTAPTQDGRRLGQRSTRGVAMGRMA